MWVTKRLIEYGRSRARSLGWPDVYTFTKAMGERAVEELAAGEDLPLSIVRPSIIESALLHPFPGLDRRVQDGRPHHPGLRPGADPRVPRHPRGHRRPDPRGLRRERAAGGGGEPAGRRRGAPLQRQLRLAEPAALLRAVRMEARLLRGASAARARSRRAQGPGLELPGPAPGGEHAAARRAPHRHRRAGRHAPAEVQGDARRGHASGP